MTTHVRSKDVEMVLELPGQRIECLGTRREAVDADHRRCTDIAPIEVMQPQAVYRNELARRLRWSCHGKFPFSSCLIADTRESKMVKHRLLRFLTLSHNIQTLLQTRGAVFSILIALVC